MVTKKRSDETAQKPSPAKRTTTKRTSSASSDAPRPKRAASTAVSAAKKPARPKLRASHANAAEGKRGPGVGALRRTTTISRSKGPAPSAARAPAVRKTPLATPKRTQPRKAAPETPSAARQLALDIVAGGLEKKALNCEIIDVRGRVDYADFLVIMTGRSDRHVSSIAQGIEAELSKKKIAAISIEGMTVSTWVLLDYGDVVVHVFQEDARQLYDIEGLWMDAGRLPVPAEEGQTQSRAVAVESKDDEDDAEEDEAADDDAEDDAEEDDAADDDDDETEEDEDADID